jgi:pimeloyl-ACP methyl ester carboxylesterase
MLKQISTAINITVATVISSVIIFSAADCNKGTASSFKAEYQDSLTQKDLLWLNSLTEGKDSIGMISGIEKQEIDKAKCPQYKNKYVFYITQPIDHKHPEAGTFKQRVVICFAGYDRPVNYITEGYTVTYALNPKFNKEISSSFITNTVIVEHRYFGKSVPFVGDTTALDKYKMNWDYLTGEQAAADLHAVREKLGLLFKGKWIASGWSKGACVAVSYASFYPKDMACSVVYEAPFCNGVNDDRIMTYMRDTVWTPEVRAKLIGYQRELIKREKKIVNLMFGPGAGNNPASIMQFEYSVLLGGFTFYQWGGNPDEIPDVTTATNEELVGFTGAINKLANTEEVEANFSFCVQQAKEMGFSTINIEPFKDIMTQAKSGRDLLNFSLDGLTFDFDNTLYNRVHKFVTTTKSKMLFIYGAHDPCTAVRLFSTERKNLKLYIIPDACHTAAISTMPSKMKAEALSTLSSWLGVSAAN